MPTPEEAAVPETAPVKGPKKNMWIVIVSIIVVAALIGVALYVLVMPAGEDFEVWTSPESVSVALGESINIYAYAQIVKGNDETNVSEDLDMTWDWASGATSLGTLIDGPSTGIQYVTFTSTSQGTSTIEAIFEYTDSETDASYEETLSIDVTVGPAVLSTVAIDPASAVIIYSINKTQEFTVVAYMSDGTEATGATFSWALSDDAIGELSATTGSSVVFNASVDTGEVTLTCTATLGDVEKSENAYIEIVPEPPEAEISTTIYDLFNVPYESWWYWRTSEERVIHNTYPYIEVWLGNPSGNNWVYSTARMSSEARNMTSVNSTERPVYVPMLGDVTGGNIEIDWYANYITSDEANDTYSPYVAGMYDGWYWRWNGTVTMDKTAAKMVLDITDTEYDNFEAWKASSFGAFTSQWSNWLALEAGDGGRVDIKYAYEYPWNPLAEDYDIEKVGDDIVFHIDHLSWGAESLLGKWWAETFLSYEYWPEDVTFHADIGPAWSHFDIEMAIMYSLYAKTDPETGIASWVFENMHADALYSSAGGGGYVSELNPYDGQVYWCYLTANAFYNETIGWDYVPWAWDLSSANYTLMIEWPDSDDIIGYQHNGSNKYDKYYTGYVIPRWIEPVPGEVPDNVMIDLDARTIIMKGPMDTIAWSQNTWASERIQDNRTRMDNPDLLPYGVPFIEFQVHPTEDDGPVPILLAPDYVNPDSDEMLNGTASWAFSGTISSWDWEFGDGTTGTGMEVMNNWTTPGTYKVNLTVTDDSARSSTASKWILVTSNIKPVANFNTNGTLMALETIAFNSTSVDPDGNITAWDWDFGDGSTGTGENVTHVYADGGRYSVKLTVTDDGTDPGPAIGYVTKIVEVAYNSTVPLAKILAPSHALVDEVITLDASKSMTLGGAAITDWDWDFGDGTTDSGEVVTHSWSTAGAKTVTLVITDDNGSVSTATPTADASKVINVYSDEVAGIGLELSRHSLMPDETADLTINVVDANGNLIADFSGLVNITCNETVGVTLPATYTFDGTEGGTVTLAAAAAFANDGAYKIIAEYDAGAVTGSEYATVAERTVEIRIYDIFQYPLYDFWELRDSAYAGLDQRYMTAPSDPSVHIYRTNTAAFDEAQLYTTYRMELEARNVPNINMSNPTFVPIVPDWTTWIDEIPGVTGGNATYELYLQYMTHTEVVAEVASGLLGPGATASDDGWFVRVDANLSMDREAAARLIGLPLGLDEAGVMSWWVDDMHDYDVRDAWEAQWWPAEANADGRVDMRAAYDGYNIDILTATDADYTLTVLDGGDTINISMTRVTWGEEVILVRQLFYGGEAFSPTDPYTPCYPNWSLAQGILPIEPWPEDMHMIVDIGPESGDVWFDTAITYGFRAWEDPAAPAGTPVWRWEANLADYFPVAGIETEMTPWQDPVNLKTVSYDPGSVSYGKDLIYDAVPAVVDLIVGESMVFERPDYMIVGFVPKVRAGNYWDSLEVIKQWGYASYHVSGIDEYVIDAMTGDVKFVGPYYPDIVPHPDDPTIHLSLIHI